MWWEKIKSKFRDLADLMKQHVVLIFFVTLSLAVSSYFVLMAFAASFAAVVLTSLACIFLGAVLGGVIGSLLKPPYTGPDKLSHVPKEVMSRITEEFLDPKDKAKNHLSLVSKGLLHLTNQTRDAQILKKFLLHVAHGKQDQAEGLLRCGNPSKWLLMKGEFTDYSDRTYHCTAYQYAYWAKDRHMCRMLERYMDDNTRSSVLKLIYDAQTEQDIELDYRQQGETRRSAHFDFTPLKEALNGLCKASMPDNLAHVETASQSVGKAQRDLPAHVAQEYCRPDRSFRSPEFNEPTLPRGLVYTFEKFEDLGYLGLQGIPCSFLRETSWFPLEPSNSGLGFNFFIIRSGRDQPCTKACDRLNSNTHAVDFKAICLLDEVRTADLEQSRANLNQQAISLEMQAAVANEQSPI